MWMSSMRRQDKSPFWELLKLLGDTKYNHPSLGDKVAQLAEPTDDEADPEEPTSIFCPYCTNKFPTERLLEWHFNYCREMSNVK